MLGVESDIGDSALRLWTAAGAAALLVFVGAVAFEWARTRAMARIGVVVIGAGLGAMLTWALTWAVVDAVSNSDRLAERRALESRAAELGALALERGSALACLDGFAGATVETACEKAIFASPAAAAGATSYIAARLALLADAVAYSKRGGHVDSILVPLRHSLEADRYGFVAQALATLDGCTAESCPAFSLLHDPSRVRAHLSGQTLDHYLDRYAAVWAQPPETPVADAAVSGQAGRKLTLGIDFPSAASIPPVSIMNPEPKSQGAAVAAVAAGADTSAQAMANPAAPAPVAAAKRSRKPQAAGSPAPAAAVSPPLAVAPVTAATPGDPVWTPGATLAAPQIAATPSQ